MYVYIIYISELFVLNTHNCLITKLTMTHVKMFSIELWCMFFCFVAQIVDVFYFRPIFPTFIPLNKKWQTPRIVCHALPCWGKLFWLQTTSSGPPTASLLLNILQCAAWTNAKALWITSRLKSLESGSQKKPTRHFSVWWNDMMAWDNFPKNLGVFREFQHVTSAIDNFW